MEVLNPVLFALQHEDEELCSMKTDEDEEQLKS